ncbi:MAG: flippase [Dehalococcoidia bacterium]
MSTVRRIAKNTGILLVAQGISYVLAFFYTIYAARYLGPANYGIIALALAFTGFFGVFMDFGVHQLITRNISRDKNLASNYIFNISLIKAVLVLVTYGVMAVAVNLMGYSNETVMAVYLMGLSTVAITFYMMLFSVLQAFERMEFQAIGQVVSSLIIMGGVIVAVHYKMDVVSFALLYAIANSIVLIYSIVTVRFGLGGSALSHTGRFKIDLDLCKTVLKQAWPIGLILVLVTIRLKADTVMLSLYSGDSAVGIYNAAYRFIDIAMVIPSILVLALFPTLSFLYKSSAARYDDACSKAFKYLLLIALPMAFFVTIFARQLINLSFGPNYADSVIVLRILIWAGAVMYLTMLTGSVFIAADKQTLSLKIASVSVLVNLALNLILIPKFSYMGAAATVIVSELFGLIVALAILTKSGHKLNILSIVKAPLIGMIAVGLILLLAVALNINLIVAGISALIVYGLIVFKLGIHSDDVALAKELLKIENK